MRENYDVSVKWRYFPLHPDTPDEGKSLADLFAGRGMDLQAMYQRMKGLMDAEGLDYGERTHTYNSRLAQELACWADGQPGFEAIHDALYRAYFVDRKNLAEPDVLVEIAGSVGLDTADAAQMLEQRSFSAAIDEHWQSSRSYGVTGVPTFVAAGRGVVGAQPYEALEQLVTQGGARTRA